MNAILENIFKENKVFDENGEFYPLHSHTNRDQGLFLQDIISKIKPVTSLEIGLAYGISSLFILESLDKLSNPATRHIIAEPYPDIYWNNIGLFNIRKSGYHGMVDFKKDRSENVLIALINQQVRLQFAYIDSTKVFDILLNDFFLINKMTDIGGVIVFDDCTFPAIRKLVRFIATIPFYKIYATHDRDAETFKKRITRRVASGILENLPYAGRIFPGISFKTDERLGTNFQCIAFQKIDNDNRNWDWHEDF